MDAAAYWYRVGHLFQRVSAFMDKHRIVLDQQLCTCGRIAVRRLPMFGLRCEVACEQWDLARHAIAQINGQLREADRPLGQLQDADRPSGQLRATDRGRAGRRSGR